MSGPQRALDPHARPAERSRPQTQTHPRAGPRCTAVNGWALHPGTLSAQEVLQLQRLAGNRATVELLSQRVLTVQRAVSASASWPPAHGGVEATQIQQLNALIPNAENAGTAAVATNTGFKTPRQANYIQNPSARTWGYVVEEKLDPLAQAAGWSTQHRLLGARPDYYRQSNGIESFVDLTSATQAGLGGNHITEKLDNAGFMSPDPAVVAADVTHLSSNPRGNAGTAVVLGNATMPELNALQQYRRLTKTYLLKNTDVDFNEGIAALFQRYGDVKHAAFTTKWKGKKRQVFTKLVTAALTKPKGGISKKHHTRSQAKLKKKKST
jgi:hypothetical protein